MKIIYINYFEHDGRCYRLTNPIDIFIHYDDGLWIFSNEMFSLYGYAEIYENALRELNENFDFIYREIVQENDEKLDKFARELKYKIANNIDRIKEQKND